jgi:tetratricopeptide (TPR) repeat protein
VEEALVAAPFKVCLYLFLAALAVRGLYLSQYATTPFFWVPQMDALYHDLAAQEIAAGKWSQEPFFRAPLYYHLLGLVYKVFGHSYWAARGVQAMIGSGSCVLLYLLGLRLFRPGVAVLAGAAMALYGPLVYFDGELHTPVVEVFLGLVFLLSLVRAGQTGTMRDWLLAGALLGLAAVARPNILVVTPLALWWLAARETLNLKREGVGAARWGLAAVFLAAAAVAPGVVTARNLAVSGDRVFIASQGGINLFLGNRPEADGFTPSTPKRYAFDGPYEDSVALYGQRAAEEALGRPLKASESQAYWMGRVADWWREQPGAALALLGKKWLLAWTADEVRNNTDFEFIRGEFAPSLWAAPFGFWFAASFGLLGMGLAWRADRQSRVLAGFVLLYTGSFVLFFAADRFRLPVVPVLLLFGVFAVFRLAEEFQARNYRRVAPLAAGLAACALLVNVPWVRTATPERYALDHWSAGNRYRVQGRLDAAVGQYRKALALDPRNAEIWMNLGVAQYGTGDLPAAGESFRQALRLNPADGSLYYNLAMCELQLGRKDESRRLLVEATRLAPEHRRAQAELAKLTTGG